MSGSDAASLGLTGEPPLNVERRPLVRRLLDFVFGYDFFISYAWSDGRTYAEQLARRLETSGFDVFLDRDDFASGDDWRSVGGWTLRRTGQLILVGSPDALRSEPVAHEIEIFAQTGRRIIPIDFGGSIDRVDPASPLKRHLSRDLLKISEPAEALGAGPSDETLATIRRTFTIVRQDKKRVRVLAVVAAVLAALAIAAAIFGVRASISEGRAQQANQLAQKALVAEQRERERAIRGEAAAEESARRARAARDREAAAREAEAEQRRIAVDRQRFAEQQRRIAEQQRQIAVEQRRTAEMRQYAAEAGQRFTEAATHFARAETAGSDSDVEILRRRELREQIAALGQPGEPAAEAARQLRLRNLEAEVAEAERRLAALAEEAQRERAQGSTRLTEGQDLWGRVQAMGGAGPGLPAFAPQLPGLFAVEVLSVAGGQSLIVHFGPPDAPRFAVIDGGAGRVFQRSLGPRLRSLRQRWSPSGPLRLELVAVSNQDDERLNGIMDLVEEQLDRRGQGLAPEFEPARVWHNTFGPTDRAIPNQKMRSRALIEELGLPLNAPFDHLVMRPPSGRLTIALPGGLNATILHPTEEALRNLFRVWQRNIDDRRRGSDGATAAAAPLVFPTERFSSLAIAPPGGVPRLSPEQLVALRRPEPGVRGPDTSVPNLASIVILFEYGGRRFLHTGDARGHQILEGLDAAGLLDENGRIDLDLLLIPHMGSERNVTTEFFSRVRARQYLFTGDGTFGNPDDGTLNMLFNARRGDGDRGDCIELLFLNRDGEPEFGPRIDAFFAALPEGTGCFRRVFRSGSREALTVDLLGRIRY